MTEVAIRECQAGDLPAVRELLKQLAEVAGPEGDFRLETLEQTVQEMACQPDLYMNLVAESAGQVAGFASVIFYKLFFHRGGTALINELVISRELRGQGIGRAIIQAIIDAARARGMDEVEVGTEQANLTARRFYKRCGFDQEYVLYGMDLA